MKDPAKYPGIRWTSNTLYVDIETGEQLTKNEVRLKYTIINTTSDWTLNKIKTHGKKTYIKQCTKSQQGRLF